MLKSRISNANIVMISLSALAMVSVTEIANADPFKDCNSESDCRSDWVRVGPGKPPYQCGHHSACGTVCVILPFRAQSIDVKSYVSNSHQDNWIRHDGNGEPPIGWSRWTGWERINRTGDETKVCRTFMNWKHDWSRDAGLVVRYNIPSNN